MYRVFTSYEALSHELLLKALHEPLSLETLTALTAVGDDYHHHHHHPLHNYHRFHCLL